MQDEPRNSSFSTPVSMRRLDDVRLDHEVVVEELGRRSVSLARMPPTLAAARNTDLRPLCAQPASTAAWSRRSSSRAAGGQELAVLPRQPAHERAADHAAMAGDPDALARQRKRYACHVGDCRRLASRARSLAHHLRDQLARSVVFGFQPSSRAPCWDRRAADRPRSGGNSADRSRTRSCRLLAVDAVLVDALAAPLDACGRPRRRRSSTNSRTECVSPVAST